MAFAIMLQGLPKGVRDDLAICSECGNMLAIRVYKSLPFVGVPEIELEVMEIICKNCDTHVIGCDVVYTETKEPPRGNQGGLGNQSKDSIVH